MSNKRDEVYKCELCGNVVEILTGQEGELTCCGEPMVKMVEKTQDAKAEKHVPVLEDQGTTIKVKVGSVPHPMDEDHYIEWIEVINGDYVNRKHLKPGDKPEAEFYVHKQAGLIVRSYCNLHGLWKA